MINLVVVSSDLQPHVLDTRVKRGAELSTDHHLVAKRTAAQVVSEAKTRIWEEFSEAMEKDYWMASGKFWQTVQRLKRGKQLSANTVYSGGGDLLALTGDIVGRWKEYFEDLLNATDMPSVEEPEAEDSEVDSFITQAEVTEVVQQLLGGKAPGVDEIRPEYLKSLDVVGLSWLTRLCNIAWWSGTVPLDWATGVVVPLFKKGDRREEQCDFRPGHGTLDQLYTLHRVLEGLWEFAQPVHMCFVDLEKAFNRVPRGILWEVLLEYGVRGPLLRAVRSLYNWSRSLVRIASCKSDLFPVHVGLRQGCPILFIVFMDRISRCSLGLEGVRFGDHRISLLIFADDVVLLAASSLDLQHALGHFAAECEAAGMRVSTSKSEAMVLDRKKVACTLQVGGEVLPQVEEFKYLGVLFTSEGRMDREIDRRISAAAAVMWSMYRSVVVMMELSWKAKLLIYQSIYVPTLTYGHELWVMTERIRSRIQAGEMSFLCRVVGRSLRGRVCPTGKRPQGRPRTRWRDYVSQLAWECLRVPPEELEEVDGLISKDEMMAYFLRANPILQCKMGPGFIHNFQEMTYLKPTFCEHCAGFLWGIIKQGYKCKGVSSVSVVYQCVYCGVNCHKQCRELLVLACRRLPHSTSLCSVSPGAHSSLPSSPTLPTSKDEDEVFEFPAVSPSGSDLETKSITLMTGSAQRISVRFQRATTSQATQTDPLWPDNAWSESGSGSHTFPKMRCRPHRKNSKNKGFARWENETSAHERRESHKQQDEEERNRVSPLQHQYGQDTKEILTRSADLVSPRARSGRGGDLQLHGPECSPLWGTCWGASDPWSDPKVKKKEAIKQRRHSCCTGHRR
ncbi:hypothetical protein QTP70_034769 [Hemibagrus guttatus]|uniref:Phorbol-ester/DAG-type domain-containing protein n=1 Tax=Hemibagrus guttatus TaxID=175788 RepID=A0AAE0V5L9_9TELE|nr:hypothetical protein QTP70_034769 [Hemibagrus guttatus]